MQFRNRFPGVHMGNGNRHAFHPRTPRIPRVYMAGKIAKNDWRHGLVPDLRGHLHEDGPVCCGWFTYVGPFFVSCDHGCRHRPGSHGVAGAGCDAEYISPASVLHRNQAALQSADLIFAYITAPDCHGTNFEIGFAYGVGIPVFLHFAHGIDPAQFWYENLAVTGSPNYSIVAHEDLPKILDADIRKWRQP